MDKEISQNLKMILKKRGVNIHTSVSVQRVEQEGELYTCVFTEKEQEVRVSAKYVLCAIGRCPNTEGLFGKGVSPEMERGRIVVDENFQSSLLNVSMHSEILSRGCSLPILPVRRECMLRKDSQKNHHP